MPTDPKVASGIVAIFRELVISVKDRLAKGTAMRNAAMAQIQKGESPTGYWVEWVRETARGICGEYLMKAIEEFNAAHPDDCIQALDLSDVLATAQQILLSNVKKG